jgi:ABC-2 type transport system ATP-binding protein
VTGLAVTGGTVLTPSGPARAEPSKCERFLANTQLKPQMRVRELSKGMIVQLHLALVMAIDAKLLVLDEPTLGLDILYRKQFYQRLLEDYFDEEKTILVTTHQVEEIEHILTDVMFIRDGKIVLNAPMDEVGGRYTEVLVNADKLDAARSLKPIDERALPFGMTAPTAGPWPSWARPARRAWPTCSSPP